MEGRHHHGDNAKSFYETNIKAEPKSIGTNLGARERADPV